MFSYFESNENLKQQGQSPPTLLMYSICLLKSIEHSSGLHNAYQEANQKR